MSIIANTELFYTHALETYLIGGLIIFLIGLFIGWILWRHCEAQADRVETLNANLVHRKSVLMKQTQKLNQLVDEIPQDPTA